MNLNDDEKQVTLLGALNKLLLSYAYNLLFLLFIAFLLFNAVPYVTAAIVLNYLQCLVILLLSKILYSAITRSMYYTFVESLFNIILFLVIVFLL